MTHYFGISMVVDLFNPDLASEADDPEGLGHAPGVMWTNGDRVVRLHAAVDHLYQVYFRN